MPHDFGLMVDPLTGEVDFEYDPVKKDFVIIDDCRNNLILSVMISKKSYFAALDFGSTHRDIKKQTAGVAGDIKRRIESAVKWIIDAGRCTEITVIAEEDRNDMGRINIELNALQANGLTIPFTTFVRVI
jgi:phage gp46-like protein